MKIVTFILVQFFLYGCGNEQVANNNSQQEEALRLEIGKSSSGENAYAVRFWLKQSERRAQYIKMIDDALPENIYLITRFGVDTPLSTERVESGLPNCISYITFFKQHPHKGDTLMIGKGIPITGNKAYIIGD